MAGRSNRPAGLAYGLAFAVEPFGSHFSLAFDFARRCEKLSTISGRKRECRKRMMVSQIRRQTELRRLRLRGTRIGWHRCQERGRCCATRSGVAPPRERIEKLH